MIRNCDTMLNMEINFTTDCFLMGSGRCKQWKSGRKIKFTLTMYRLPVLFKQCHMHKYSLKSPYVEVEYGASCYPCCYIKIALRESRIGRKLSY